MAASSSRLPTKAASQPNSGNAAAHKAANNAEPVLPETLLNGVPNAVLKAERKLRTDFYNTDSWTAILLHFQGQGVGRAREVFDRFLEAFPTAAHYWKFYVDKEMEAKNFQKAEDLFSKCLTKVPDVELWRSYMDYIRLVKSGEPDERASLSQAYEFTLQHVGMDYNSSQIWTDYIDFLQGQEARHPHEESQKISIIRGVYQRAVATPLSNTELIWKQYDQWEHKLHKDLAQGILAQQQPIHLKVLTVKREIKRRREGLLQHMLARPPVIGTHGQMRDYRQVVLWKALIDYERSNPLRLDQPMLRSRVSLFFRQALLTLRHYPEVWEDFCLFLVEKQQNEEAAKVYEEAIVALSDCHLMYFLYADFNERRRNVQESKRIYEKLIESNPSSLAYIEFLRFLRRTEGPSVARKAFIAAIKSPACTHHIYVAAALMEYHANNEVKFSINIFNAGMKKYARHTPFLLSYLDFLEMRNDRQNMRVIFEQALRDVPPAESEPLWDRFVQFQKTAGDFQLMEEAESRRAAALKDIKSDRRRVPMLDMIERKRFADLWPCSKAYREALALAPALSNRRSARRSRLAIAEATKDLPRPDVSKLRKLLSAAASAPVAHLPPAAISEVARRIAPNVPLVLRDLLMRLPPPTRPPLHVDRLLHTIASIDMVRLGAAPSDSAAQDAGKGGKRRMREEDAASARIESMNASQSHQPPSNDIYRRRQASKMARHR